MNRAAWTWQRLWGVLFSVTGFGRILGCKPEVWKRTLPQVSWFSAVPQYLFVFIGICGFLGGVDLILAALFHTGRAEYFLPINVERGRGGAFIAYGRRLVRPISPPPINPSRVLPGSQFRARSCSSVLHRSGTGRRTCTEGRQGE